LTKKNTADRNDSRLTSWPAYWSQTVCRITRREQNHDSIRDSMVYSEVEGTVEARETPAVCNYVRSGHRGARERLAHRIRIELENREACTRRNRQGASRYCGSVTDAIIIG
jgi:hypothetical protein